MESLPNLLNSTFRQESKYILTDDIVVIQLIETIKLSNILPIHDKFIEVYNNSTYECSVCNKFIKFNELMNINYIDNTIHIHTLCKQVIDTLVRDPLFSIKISYKGAVKLMHIHKYNGNTLFIRNGTLLEKWHIDVKLAKYLVNNSIFDAIKTISDHSNDHCKNCGRNFHSGYKILGYTFCELCGYSIRSLKNRLIQKFMYLHELIIEDINFYIRRVIIDLIANILDNVISDSVYYEH